MGLTKYDMASSQETFDVGPEWFEHVRTSGSQELFSALEEAGSLAWGNLVGLALGSPVTDDVPDLLERIAGTAARDLWLIMAGYHHPPFRDQLGAETFLRAATGDQEARRALGTAARKLEGDESEFSILGLDANRAKDLVMEVVRRWSDELFAPERDAVSATLDRDAQAKVALADVVSPEDLIETATGGLEFRPERWIGRVILLPHVAMRPWNVSGAWEDAEIICYPVADESLGIDPTAPPTRLLRLYKALSDDKRLSILKILARSSATLQELADAVGLAKSTAHHHMVILRSAGLVRVTTELRSTYSLRRDAIREPTSMLREFLEEDWT